MLMMSAEIASGRLRFRIACVVGFLLAAVLGITAWHIVSERDSILTAATMQAEGYVRALEEHAGSALSESDHALREVVNDVRVDGGVERMDRRKLHLLLRRQAQDSPQIGALFVVDRPGRIIANSRTDSLFPIDVADREYFRHYLEPGQRGIYVSRPLVSRMANRWRFNLVRPLEKPGGAFDGIVAIGFDIDYFEQYYRSLRLGPRGEIYLTRTDGVAVVAEPFSERALGRDCGEIVRRLKSSPAGVYAGAATAGDPLPRITAYRQLSRFPLVAVVSLSRDDVLAGWKRKAGYEATMTVVLCLIILFITSLLFRRLNQLEKAQEELSRQEEMVREKAAQVDAATDAIVILAEDGRIVQCNNALRDMTGYAGGELAGMRLCDLTSDHGGDCVSGIDTILARRDATMETVFRTRSGGEVPVEVHARVMERAGGRRILAIVRDIRERKRGEGRERARLRILEEMATGCPLSDVLTSIARFVEQEAERTRCAVLLPNVTGELFSCGVAPEIPGLDRALADGVPLSEAPASGWRRRAVVLDLAADPLWGRLEPLRAASLSTAVLEPVLSSQGLLLGVIACFRRRCDAPEEAELRLLESAAHLASIAIERFCAEHDRTLLEEQLHHVQRIEAVGQLAGGIAHDFNNLLTPILCYADLILLKSPGSELLADKVQAIIAAARKARDLTQQLLSFGRKQTLIIKTVDLNVVIEGFREMMRRTIRENIAIDLRLAPGGLAIRADQGQLEQILLNLALNAQDAIRGNGVITIETGHIVMDTEYVRLHPGLQPGPYALLSFSDTGCGMNDETLVHIFEPFFTTKQVGHGTGLGLATVYGIIKQHEGSVTVRSSEGVGTTFCIYLPLSREAVPAVEDAAAVPAVAVPAASGAGRTVLVVEDNDMVRTIMVEVLETAGYRVLAAAAPSEALELARREGGGVSLLVSDVVMPEMGGQELYEELAAILPGLPVLYISGYTNELFAHNGLLEEEVNFLQKPFSTERLLEQVHRLAAPPAG